MKAKYLTKNKQLTFEVEADTQAEMFEALAEIQEVFDAEHTCGICNSSNLRYIKRTVQGNDYYELRCEGVNQVNNHVCGARFDFGQIKHGVKGALFPKRKDKIGPEGKYLPDRGWYKYTASTAKEPDPWS